MSLAKRKLEEENERFLAKEDFKIRNSRNKAESLQEIIKENQKTGRKIYFEENTEAFNEDDAMLIHDKSVKCKLRIMSDTPFAIANDSSTLQILPDFTDNADDIAIARDSLTNEGKYTDNEIGEKLSVDHQFIRTLGQTASSPKSDFLGQTARSPKIDFLGQTAKSPKINFLGKTARSPKIDFLGQPARSPKIDFLGQTASSPKIDFLGQTARSPKIDFLGQTARSPKIDFLGQTARSPKIDFLGQPARSPKIDFLGQTARSPKIDFLEPEDPDQKAHFNGEINEAKECDAEELCTDWCITEVKGNCHVLFGDVKSEVLQNFVECDKVNDEINQLKVTEVDGNDSCDHRNTSTTDFLDYNFISNKVPCKLMQTNYNEYKIIHASTGSLLKVEKLSNLESLSEVGGPAEILTSDFTPENAEIVKNPSTSGTNEYIYNSCVLGHKEEGSRQLEQSDAYNFSCVCLTPDAENIQNNISDNNEVTKTNHTRMLLNPPVINDSEQICNLCVDGTKTDLQIPGSCKTMEYVDREEIEMDQKKNYDDLKECIKSWRTKYPWMMYHSSTFNCTLCIDYKTIFEVKNRSHIFKVASYLRQHESSSNHTRTMLNLTNNLLKYTIGFVKRTSFQQASKESLFLSLSEHLLLNEGTDSHECNEYIFSTVFKEFTTFLEQTELAFMNSNMTKSFSYILDECRQILIVRTISVSGHPEEILITKFLEETCTLSPVVKCNLSKAIFAKHVQCDRCDTCKETPLPDTNQTLPIRFPNISALTNILQIDPAVIKYTEFLTISSKTGFFKGIVHWTNLELLNALISHFPQETKNFLYMKAILEIIQTLNNAYFLKSLKPLDVAKIDNLATPLKFVLNSTSLEFMALFVIELQNKCYHDGSSNVQYFEYIFNPFYIMTFDQNPTVYKLFLQIYLSIKKHLPVAHPEAMMKHLLMFCQYVVSDRNMASLQFSLCSILLLFQENLLLRQQFSVVHKFYELIALHPFLSASREISLYGVSASFSVLIKKYGRPLAYQIMKFLHSDDVLVQQFQGMSTTRS